MLQKYAEEGSVVVELEPCWDGRTIYCSNLCCFWKIPSNHSTWKVDAPALTSLSLREPLTSLWEVPCGLLSCVCAWWPLSASETMCVQIENSGCGSKLPFLPWDLRCG